MKWSYSVRWDPHSERTWKAVKRQGSDTQPLLSGPPAGSIHNSPKLMPRQKEQDQDPGMGAGSARA